MSKFQQIAYLNSYKKVIVSDEWRDGKPIGKGTSHLFQYLRLEQYEDALNNIEFRDEVVGTGELSFLDKIRYSLDYGTRASANLFSVERFTKPFTYTMRAVQGNEIREDQPVCLITTFNYLLGLRVVRYHITEHQGREYRIVVGRKGLQAYVIIWRNFDDVAGSANWLDLTVERDWVKQQPWYDTQALTYSNADNGFGANSTEEAFRQLLWDIV